MLLCHADVNLYHNLKWNGILKSFKRQNMIKIQLLNLVIWRPSRQSAIYINCSYVILLYMQLKLSFYKRDFVKSMNHAFLLIKCGYLAILCGPSTIDFTFLFFYLFIW